MTIIKFKLAVRAKAKVRQQGDYNSEAWSSVLPAGIMRYRMTDHQQMNHEQTVVEGWD